jgi:hypothetical protein
MPSKKLAYCILLATLLVSAPAQDPGSTHLTIVVTDATGLAFRARKFD